jgi:anti-sigma-K factor RskA
MTERTINRNQKPKKNPKNHKSRKNSQEWQVFEIWLRIIAYSALSITAVCAIARLLPYQQMQQAKLEEVRLAAQEKEERVNQLRSQFSRSFDPTQTRQVMGEQSPRRDPNQRRIFWTSQ